MPDPTSPTTGALSDPLETPDLGQFLASLTDAELDGIALLLARIPNALMYRGRALPSAIERDRLRGKALISAIMQDLAQLASHKTGPTQAYRAILQRVASRHGVEDDGTEPCSAIERKVQQHYLDDLRPDAKQFSDRGRDSNLRRAAYATPVFGNLAYLMSPHWKAVTAAVLEIAALRRIALMRQFASNLGALR